MSALKSTFNRMIQTSDARFFQCIGVLSEEEFYFEPVAGASAAWATGHIINSQDYFVSRMYDCPRQFDQFEKVFRGGRDLTETDYSLYPNRVEFESAFRQCHEVTIEKLMAFDESKWDIPIAAKEVGDSTYFSPVMMWEFIARHTFYHLGQLSVTLPRLGGSATLLYPNLSLK